MEKVAEQHILQKCSKCSRFGVMSTLLKVATIAITHLAMDLGLKNTKQAIFRLYKSATTHLWQPCKSTKKTHGRTPEKKTMAAILLTPVAAILFFRISHFQEPFFLGGIFSRSHFFQEPFFPSQIQCGI